MNSKSQFLSSWFLAAALTLSVVGTACAHHHYYRVYGPLLQRLPRLEPR